MQWWGSFRILHDKNLDNTVIGITGDHSTPAEFGDHSHEPVPVVMGTVKDIIGGMGGGDIVQSIDLGALPLPETLMEMNYSERLDTYFPWKRKLLSGKSPTALNDAVTAFSEIDCARGCLGRFPGNFVVPTLKKMSQLIVD